MRTHKRDKLTIFVILLVIAVGLIVSNAIWRYNIRKNRVPYLPEGFVSESINKVIPGDIIGDSVGVNVCFWEESANFCKGNLILVNKSYPAVVTDELITLPDSDIKLHQAAADALTEMLQAMSQDTSNELENLYTVTVIKGYDVDSEYPDLSSGYSVQLGFIFNGTTISCTEEDISSCDEITAEKMSNSKKWLEENCQKYGFILRYAKQNVTNIPNNSSIFRYVGIENATAMTDNNHSLEEFLDKIHQSTYENRYAVGDSYMYYVKKSEEILTEYYSPEGYSNVEISGDNIEGFIVKFSK